MGNQLQFTVETQLFNNLFILYEQFFYLLYVCYYVCEEFDQNYA